MRALLAGTGAGRRASRRPVNVTVTANGQVAQELEITPETADVFRLVDLTPFVRAAAPTPSPWRLRAAATSPTRSSPPTTCRGRAEVQAEDKPLEIDVAYDRTRLETDDLLGCAGHASATTARGRPG